MHVPKPLPDELLNGYVGRIASLNGIARVEARSKVVNYAEQSQGTRRVKNWVLAIAPLMGMTWQQVVLQHTLLPFTAAVRPKPLSGGLKPSCPLSALATRSYGDRMHLCQDCVQEDLRFWGISYWRRSHQLPGMFLCPKHRRPLLRIRTPKYSELPLPQEEALVAHPLEPDAVAQAQSNVVIDRFASICVELLERSEPFLVGQMSAAIQPKLRARFGSGGSRTGERWLSEIAQREAGGPWLRLVFPELDRQDARGKVPDFDRVGQNRVFAAPSKRYALALALLYDSSDDALNAVANSPHRRAPRTGVPPDLVAAFELFKSGMTLAAAAKTANARACDLEDLVRRRAVRWKAITAVAA